MNAVWSGFLLLVLTSCKMPWTYFTASRDTLRISLGSDPLVADPQLAETGVGVFVARQLTSTLLEVTPDLKIVALDAESFSWENDGKVLRLKLRPTLSWSDGKALNICQYRDGIVRALNPKLLVPYADLFFDIEGAEDLKLGRGSLEKLGIECHDEDQSLRLKVRHAYSNKTLYALAFVNSAPARLDLISKDEDSWLWSLRNNTGVSNGSFVLKSWQREQRLVFERRANAPDYLAAKIAHLEMPVVRDANTAFTMYESGQLDVLDEVSPYQLQKLKGRPDYHSTPWLTTYMIGFSFKSNPLMKNLNFRKALAAAAHQEEIPLLLPTGEEGALGWVPPSLIPEAYRRRPSLFNPALGKKLLADVPEAKKPPLPRLYFNSGERHKMLMERMANNFREHLGLKVELYPIDWKILLSTLKFRAPDMFRYAWTSVYPDVLFFLELFHSRNINNFGGWKNAEYDALIERLAIVPLDKRDEKFWKDVQRAQDILVNDDPAIIPIYHYVKNTLIKDYVTGLGVSALGLGKLKDASF